MSFCEIQDVQDKCGTTLGDAEITRMITRAERKVKTALKREGLDYSFGTVPDEIIEATAEYAAAMCLVKHMTDKQLPVSLSINGASATLAVQDAINYHNAEGERNMREYIDTYGGKCKPYRVVGRDGERVGTYDTMNVAGTVSTDAKDSYEEEV